MHHIYHTEGIILGSRNFGEAGRYYYIFTRDLGLIHASAQGVRKMSSKLRFVLQDFTYIKIDLIAGKNIFRITNASKTDKLERITKRPDTFEVFTNIARLLKRLLAGIEPNEDLFVDLLKSLSILEKVAIKDGVIFNGKEDLRNIEAIIVLRIVNNLGYIGGNEALRIFIKSPFEFEEDIIFEAAKNRRTILSEINKALRETHL